MVCHRAFRYRPTVLGKLLGSEHCILLQLSDCWCSWCCLSNSCNQMLFLRSGVLPEKVCHLFFSCILLHSLKNVCQIYVPLFSCTVLFLFFSLFSYTGSKKSVKYMFLCSAALPEKVYHMFFPFFSYTAWIRCLFLVQSHSLKKSINYMFLCSV